MTIDEWDAVIKVHLRGTFATAHHAAVYWREQSQGRRGRRRAHHQHVVVVGHLRQRRPDQLRRGQGGHRGVHRHHRDGAAALRRHRQRDRARGAHAHDRGPGPLAAATTPRSPRGTRATRPTSRRSSSGSAAPSRAASPAACSTSRAATSRVAEGWVAGPAEDKGARWEPGRAGRGHPPPGRGGPRQLRHERQHPEGVAMWHR